MDDWLVIGGAVVLLAAVIKTAVIPTARFLRSANRYAAFYSIEENGAAPLHDQIETIVEEIQCIGGRLDVVESKIDTVENKLDSFLVNRQPGGKRITD